MFFGKDPTEVTEAELHSFLRLFVFFPAIFASLAATALALASVTPLRQPPEAIEVDDMSLVEHLLEPLTQSLEERAAKVANAAVAQAMVAHRLEPKPPEVTPGAPAAPFEPTASETPDSGTGEPPKPFGPMRPTLVSSSPPPGAA